MNIHESAEDYLDAILNLRESGYIHMDDDGCITLLPPGEEIAQRIYDRHKLLTQVFIQLGVSPETAAADACKVEHDLSDETFEKIKAHAVSGNCPLKSI